MSYYGIDASYFRPLDVERQNMFLSAGSLTPLKGFYFLIQAINILLRENRPGLVIASKAQNPAERVCLEQLAEGCQVEHKLMGNIGDQEQVGLYYRAQMTPYAPVREPFGLVTLKSMACGTLVVTERERGIQETIDDGKTGLLVDRHVNIFATAVQLLNSESDRASRLGANGCEHVLNDWTWDKAIESLKRIIYH